MEGFSERIRKPMLKICVSAAVCAALAAVCAGVIFSVSGEKSEATSGVDTVYADSAAELSEILGYEIEDIEYLYHLADEREYAAVGRTGQITYSFDGQCIVFRKSPRKGDVLGVGNDYDTVQAIKTDCCDAVIKGSGGEFSFALWKNEGFAYSVYLCVPMNLERMEGLVRSTCCTD